MKTNHCKLLQLGTFLIFSSLSFTNLCYAEKIYTWKDETGKMHYTNNPALVPLEQDDSRVINMESAPAPLPKKAIVNGEAIWRNQCATCHRITAQGGGGLRGMRKLVDAINDPSTTPTLDTIILQAALDDAMDDLANITLNSDEKQAVLGYIRKQVIRNNALETGSTKVNQPNP